MAGLKSLGFDARQTVFFCAPFSEILIYFPFKMCPGRVISKLLCSGEKEVDLAVQSAKAAFNVWSQMSGMERSRVLLEAARIIRVCCGSSRPLLERGWFCLSAFLWVNVVAGGSWQDFQSSRRNAGVKTHL